MYFCYQLHRHVRQCVWISLLYKYVKRWRSYAGGTDCKKKYWPATNRYSICLKYTYIKQRISTNSFVLTCVLSSPHSVQIKSGRSNLETQSFVISTFAFTTPNLFDHYYSRYCDRDRLESLETSVVGAISYRAGVWRELAREGPGKG